MNGLVNLLGAVAETTAAVEIDPIITGYGDMKIPVITMVMIGLGAALLLAGIIAGFYFIFDRTDNWGTALLAGIAGYLLFNYVLYMGIQFAINAIPFTKDFPQNNPTSYTASMTVMSAILAGLAIYLSMKYVMNTAMKRGQSVTIGVPLALGLGLYVGAVLTSREISNSIQYILVSVQVNKLGFDESVTATVQAMMESGEYTLEDAAKLATDSLKQFIEEPAINFLLNQLYDIVVGILETAVAVLFYGAMTEQTDRKYILIGGGFVLLSIVPALLTSLTSIPDWAGFAINTVIAAAAVYLAIKVLKEQMPEDLRSLTYSHRKHKKKDDDGKPKKMPHIVMPD